MIVTSWSERKGKSAATTTAARDRRFCVEVSASVVRGSGRQLARTGSSFYSWSGRFFGGALAEIYEYVEEDRNDSATRHLGLMLDWVETFPR